MRNSLSLLALTAAALILGAGPATAEMSTQAENLSCLTERPVPNLRVVRDCQKTPPEPVPAETVYLTPSEIPPVDPMDGSRKSNTPDRNRPSGNEGRSSSIN